MKKITVIGGDGRLKTVKERLLKEGYTVDTLGLYSDDKGDISSSDILIFPVPTTKDGKRIFTPLTGRELLISELERSISDAQSVLCCNYTFKNKNCIDYGALDSYALLNAVPTAEEAVKLAIENTSFTLWKSRCLVIGYGRVGKILADRLKALGCKVTVTARKPSDIALAQALGFECINTERLNSNIACCDIIFNTVDAPVLSDEGLKKSNCSLIIELSTYGGFNFSAAEKYQIKAIKAPGLPAKSAPDTAAEILSDTILNIINSYS